MLIIHYKCFSERNDIWAEKISRRLELATGYKLYDPKYRFTAENYQIMNYGFGGTISLHKDATTDIADAGIGTQQYSERTRIRCQQISQVN